MKQCIRCNQAKELTEFYKDRWRIDGLYPYCIPCKKTYKKLHPESKETKAKQRLNSKSKRHKQHYDKNRYDRQDIKSRLKERFLLRQYGITVEKFNQMVRDQNGLCAICNVCPKTSLFIDHNHKTGKVSKLLCMECNFGLGKFKDDPERLHNAAQYLLETN